MSDLNLTIRVITTRPVVAPLLRPVRTAVGTISAAPLVLIDIETQQGVKGRSYVFAYTPAALAPLARLIQNIGEELVGEAVAPVERMRAFDRRFRLLGWQGLVGMAVSGLDMAFWDALGHAVGSPVATLLGGEPKPLRAYDSYGAVDPRSDEGAIRKTLDQGFRAIKIKLGEGSLAKDVEVVSAVRAMIGSDVALMVDYNQSLDRPEASRRLDKLEEFDLHWVEEPVPAEDLEGHAQVRAATSIPVQTGENWWFASDMGKAIAAGASDFCMPDVMKIGGITGWLRAAALAQAAALPMSSHIFVEASAHALAVTPTAHWLEHLDFAGPLLLDPCEVVDGTVMAKGPGLGLAWDEAAVARYAT